jgi:hypothetical protein
VVIVLRVVVPFMIALIAVGCAAPARRGDHALRPGPVRAACFTREVRLVPVLIGGLEPPRHPLNGAAKRVARHLGRPVGVEEPVEVSLPAVSDDVLAAVVDDLARQGALDDGAILVVLLAGDGVTGYLQWRHSQAIGAPVPIVVLQPQAIQRRSGLFVKREKLWEWTLTHEIGHVLGVPASNTHTWAVPGLGNHCTRPECVMYTGFDWRVLWTGIVRGWPMEFCGLCAEELREARQQAASAPTAGAM